MPVRRYFHRRPVLLLFSPLGKHELTTCASARVPQDPFTCPTTDWEAAAPSVHPGSLRVPCHFLPLRSYSFDQFAYALDESKTLFAVRCAWIVLTGLLLLTRWHSINSSLCKFHSSRKLLPKINLIYVLYVQNI